VAQLDREAATAAGQKAADERDKATAALERLKRVTAERRAEQYAMTMTTLPIAWEAGNAVEARRLLDSLRPGPDEDDLRHFEWRYWERQMNAERSGVRLPVPHLGSDSGRTSGSRVWVMSEDAGRVAVLLHTKSTAVPPTNIMLVQVWDTATRKLLLSHSIPDDNRPGPVLAECDLSFSRDGKRLGITANAWVDPKPGEEGRWIRYRRQAVDVDSGKVFLDLVHEGVSGEGSSIQMSPDGRSCLTTEHKREPGSPRGESATVWNLDAGGKQLAVLPGARFVRFSSDSKRILGWDSPDSTPRWSPDGRRILGWDSPEASTPKVWDAATGREVRILDTVAARVLTPNPDGTRLYGVAFSKANPGRVVAKVLDVTTAKELSEILLPEDRPGAPKMTSVLALPTMHAISPDGSRLVVRRAGYPNWEGVEWLVIDTKDGRPLFAVDDSQRALTRGGRSLGATFSPDGKQFILHVFADNSVVIHDAITGQRLRTIRGLGHGLAAFAVTPDGQRLRTVEPDGTLKEWDLTPDQPVRIEAGGRIDTLTNQGLERSADGEWLAAYLAGSANGGKDNDTVRAWHTAGKVSKEFKYHPRDPAHNYWSGGIPVLSRDGSRLAFVRSTVTPRKAGAGNPAKQDPPGDLTVWDVASGKEVFHADGHFLRFPTAIAPDGRSVAVFRRGETGTAQIVVFDIESGRERCAISLPQGVALGVELRFRPDGKRLAGFLSTFTDDRTVRDDGTTLAVWDMADGKRIEGIKTDPFPGITPSLEWSPDGKRILVGSFVMARQATLHDAETGRLEATLDTASRGGRIPTGARPAFSADGRRIACAVETAQGRFVKVWDAATGRELLALRSYERGDLGVRQSPHLVSFSPDGNRLLDIVVKQVMRPNGAGRPPQSNVIDVTTWDATPREGPKQP
jgi:WD40 repeat protein